MKITESEHQNEKRILKNENSVEDLWNNIKSSNIPLIGFPEGEERERNGQKVYFLNVEKETHPDPGSRENSK